MTQVAMTSDSNLEISVDQVGKDTLVLLRGLNQCRLLA